MCKNVGFDSLFFATDSVSQHCERCSCDFHPYRGSFPLFGVGGWFSLGSLSSHKQKKQSQRTASCARNERYWVRVSTRGRVLCMCAVYVLCGVPERKREALVEWPCAILASRVTAATGERTGEGNLQDWEKRVVGCCSRVCAANAASCLFIFLSMSVSPHSPLCECAGVSYICVVAWRGVTVLARSSWRILKTAFADDYYFLATCVS